MCVIRAERPPSAVAQLDRALARTSVGVRSVRGGPSPPPALALHPQLCQQRPTRFLLRSCVSSGVSPSHCPSPRRNNQRVNRSEASPVRKLQIQSSATNISTDTMHCPCERLAQRRARIPICKMDSGVSSPTPNCRYEPRTGIPKPERVNRIAHEVNRSWFGRPERDTRKPDADCQRTRTSSSRSRTTCGTHRFRRSRRNISPTSRFEHCHRVAAANNRIHDRALLDLSWARFTLIPTLGRLSDASAISS